MGENWQAARARLRQDRVEIGARRRWVQPAQKVVAAQRRKLMKT